LSKSIHLSYMTGLWLDDDVKNQCYIYHDFFFRNWLKNDSLKNGQPPKTNVKEKAIFKTFILGTNEN